MAPTIFDLQVLNGVLLGIALLMTVFRLWIRFSRNKLWWDDFWVFIAALCTIVLMAANYMHTAPPTAYPQKSKIAIYYLCIQFYYAVSWTSRLSILFTTIRLCFGRLRRILIFVAGLFLLSWLVLFAQVFWVCDPEPTWKVQPIPQCILGDDVAVAQAITYVVTDFILIIAPIRLIWDVRITQSTKIRLIAVFAATLITTAASLYYIYAMLRIGGLTEEFTATIHDGVSLFVANLTVVVSFAFKLQNNSQLGDTDNTSGIANGFVRPRPPPSSTFKLGQLSQATQGPTISVNVERTYDEENGLGPVGGKKWDAPFMGHDAISEEPYAHPYKGQGPYVISNDNKSSDHSFVDYTK